MWYSIYRVILLVPCAYRWRGGWQTSRQWQGGRWRGCWCGAGGVTRCWRLATSLPTPSCTPAASCSARRCRSPAPSPRRALHLGLAAHPTVHAVCCMHVCCLRHCRAGICPKKCMEPTARHRILCAAATGASVSEGLQAAGMSGPDVDVLATAELCDVISHFLLSACPIRHGWSWWLRGCRRRGCRSLREVKRLQGGLLAPRNMMNANIMFFYLVYR